MITCEVCEYEFDGVDEFVEHLKKHGLSPADYLKTYPHTEGLHDYVRKIPRKDPPKRRKSSGDIFKDVLSKGPTEPPDKYGYFKKVKKEYIDQGFPDCEILNNMCLFQVFMADKYLKIKNKERNDGLLDVDAEDIKEIKELVLSGQRLVEPLKDIYESTREEKNIATEIEKLMVESKDFIEKNIGEFQFKCPECGIMIDNCGFPHWAYENATDEQGRNVYLIWNAQLWELVKGISIRDKYGKTYGYQIEPYVMALALETSIEGLIYTARKRKMQVNREGDICEIDGVKINIKEQETKFSDCYKKFKENHYKQNIRDL